MKNKVLIGLFILVGFFVLDFDYKVITNNLESIVYNAGSYDGELSVGTYTSFDNHTITVNEDGTVLYDNTYKLTVTASDMGYTLTGKIGTNNKAVTFYQVNDSSIISNKTVYYTHNDSTVYLYDYTGFKLSTTPVESSAGIFELYTDNGAVKRFGTLQDAVDAYNSGDVIKITKDYKVTEGVYINKDVTIDGNHFTLDRSSWNSPVFVVADGATLNLNNVTIDGGSDNWEVDYDSVTFMDYYIPLKKDSIKDDVKLTLSAVISAGNLVTDNVNINNNYTASNGGAINVVRGTATLKNSGFEHNFGNTDGGAVYVGSKFDGRTTYPVTSFVVDNCKFVDNYVANSNSATYGVGHGGAINVLNTSEIKIDKSMFKGNVAYYGKGGAISFRDQSTSNIEAEKLGLPFYNAYINETIFENNWAGNDGFAVQSYAANLYIEDCLFKKNVGTHPSSSVGTVSVEAYRSNQRIYSSIKSSAFEENIGPVSGFGDHSSLIDVLFEDVVFKGNIGNESILLYSSVSSFKNCKFINEKAVYGVIDARIYENHDVPPSLTLENVTFENSDSPADILTRKQNHNDTLNTYNVILKGKTNANVLVLNNNKVIIEGEHTGNITIDGNTESNHVVIKEEAKLNGDVVENKNTYTVIVTWPSGSGYLEPAILFLEKDRQYTESEFFLEHQLMKDGYKLIYYTDSSCKNLWDFKVSGNLTLYTKYVEHTHAYTDKLIVYKNAIYEQCECGHIKRQLGIELPSNLVFDGKAKEVKLINTLEVNEEDYKIVYYSKNNDGKYVEMKNAPVEVGEYKVVLTYLTHEVSLEYIIEKAIENPNTGIINPYIIFGFIISISVIGIVVYKKKKYI